MLLSMHYFNNYSLGVMLYTALHGTYGLLWLIKYNAFPDVTFERKVPLGTLVVCGVVMCLYWGFGILLCMGYGIQEPSGERVFISIMLLALGSVLMMASDAQKNFVLKIKKGLITDGLFARTRNPNYLGEAMVYCGLATCTGLWITWVYLFFVWASLYTERIVVKELSLMKKEGWTEYKRKSGLILPKVFERSVFDWAFYGCWISIFVYAYYMGGIMRVINK